MNEEIRILKIGKCPSLSASSTLTYHIGSKGQDVYLRLVENTAGGLFSKDWVALEVILLSLSEPVTTRSLQELFKGRSANTAGFVLAILLKEGLVKRNGRGYQRCDPSAFMTAIQELIKSEVSLSLDATEPPKTAKTTKKATAKSLERGTC